MCIRLSVGAPRGTGFRDSPRVAAAAVQRVAWHPRLRVFDTASRAGTYSAFDVPFLMPEFQDIRQIVLIADDNHCRLKRAAEISVCIDAHPTISRRGVRWLCVAGEAACSGMAALPAACHSAGESGVEK